MAAESGDTAALLDTSDRPSTTWNILDLAGDLTMIVGLAGFAATGAAGGWWGRIGLSAAFAGLGVFTLAGVAGFFTAEAGDVLHPISVPLTGAGMPVTGVAVLRTGRWRGWPRYAPLACGLTPFVIELPDLPRQAHSDLRRYRTRVRYRRLSADDLAGVR